MIGMYIFRREVYQLNPYKKLLGNSALFAIGNLGSKIISIILVPLYTYYLSTAEYGTVDLVTTTSNMLLPIVSLSIYDAVLRFMMDDDHDNKTVFTNAVLVSLLGTVVVLLIYPILAYFNFLGEVLPYMAVILILQSFQSLLAQFARAVGFIKIFALNGIIMTLVTGLMNILLIVYLKTGIQGYLSSIVISNVVSILFFVLTTKAHRYLSKQVIQKSAITYMLKYSVPLIPNAFMWWIMNASNRYFIFLFVGASANGLFAVANKIPSLLSILNTIFFQAWQLSAIEEYDSEGKASLYSDVFSYFSIVMFLGTSALITVIKPVIGFAVESSFYESWRLVPFLLLGVVFSSFSSFLGTNYIAAKQTSGIFRTSVIGGIASIITNAVFVPLIGTNGASISTMVSFFIIWVLRARETSQFVDMTFDVKNIFLNLVIIFVQIGILFIGLSSATEIMIELMLFFVLLVINKKLLLLLKDVLLKIKKK